MFYHFLHGSAGKHPGIARSSTRVLLSFNCVICGELCPRALNMHERRTHTQQMEYPGKIILSEWDPGPEEIMQNDLLPELSPSGGF